MVCPDVVKSLIGEYETDVTSCIYGPGGAGKTLLCILAFVDSVKRGKKVIFIDTEGGFSVDRVKQISKDYESLLSNMIFFNPKSFNELTEILSKLSALGSNKVGLIIVDTMTNFFRVEIADAHDKKIVNEELAEQLLILSDIRKKLGIPIIITTQVYSDMDEKNKVNPIGGDIIKGRCKTIIEIEKLHGSMRRAKVIKNRYEDAGKSIVFEIVKEGVKLV